MSHSGEEPVDTGSDKDIDMCSPIANTTSNEIARRMLCKASSRQHPNAFAVRADRCNTLFTQKEQEAKGIKIGKATFRDVAKACPVLVGTFDAVTDCLSISIPEDASDEFAEALKGYANMTVATLKTVLGKEETRGGVRRKDMKAM